MKWDKLVSLGEELPAVTVSTSYGTPALKVGKKLMVRLKEDGASVVFMTDGTDEQQALIDAKPDVYFITDHYRGYGAVLARLAKLTVQEARVRLERAWELQATPKIKKSLA